MGLLDGFQMSPKTAGLLGMAEGLLAASGAHRLPVTLGQGLGMGLQNGMQQYQTAQQAQAHDNYMAAMTALEHSRAQGQQQANQQNQQRYNAQQWVADHMPTGQPQGLLPLDVSDGANMTPIGSTGSGLMPHLMQAYPQLVGKGLVEQQFPPQITPYEQGQLNIDRRQLGERVRHDKANEGIESTRANAYRQYATRNGPHAPTLTDATAAYHKAYPYAGVPFDQFLQQYYPQLAPHATQPSNAGGHPGVTFGGNFPWFHFGDYGKGGELQRHPPGLNDLATKHMPPRNKRSTSTYASPDAVRQAYQAGKLSKAQATNILQKRFGYH